MRVRRVADCCAYARNGRANNANVAAPAMNSLRSILSLRPIWDASVYTTILTQT